MGIPLIYTYSYPKNSGVLLTILGVDDGKQEIMSRLGVTEGEGYMHFPRDDKFFGRRGYDREYFKGLISERKVIRRMNGVPYYVWEPVNDKARNESLDLAVYNFACVQTCVGKNPDEFWRSRRELLNDEPKRTKKKKSRSISAGNSNFKEVDIWS